MYATRRRLATARATVARFESVLAVVAGVGAGLLVPAPDRLLSPLVPVLVIFLVYASFRDLRLGPGSRSLARPALAALGISYVGLPLAAAAFGRVALPAGAATGLLVIVAGPTTAGSALVWTRLGGGDVRLAGVTVFASLLLAPIVTPGVLALLLGRQVSIAAVPMIRDLVVVIGGGLVLARFVPERVVDDDRLRRASLAAVAVLVYASAATSDFGTTRIAVVATVALFSAGLTGAGFALARLGRGLGLLSDAESRAVFFAATLKNLGVALVVVGALGADGAGVVAVAVFYVVQQLLSGLATDLR